MRLAVVIVNWNSCDDLRACLSSVREQTHRDLHVIVIDNGSTDGSVAMVQRDFPEVTLLPQGENLGFAEACNRGIAASETEWVVMLNNDTVAQPDWAAELVAAAEDAPASCGMLQSLQLYLDRPEIINSTGIELTRTGTGRDRHDGKALPPSSRSEEIFCPTAGAAAYRRSMLESVRLPTGYFDREHFLYYEDMDLGWRARLAGWSALYVPSSVVLHRYHGSTSRQNQRWIKTLLETNNFRTLTKNASLRLMVHPVRVVQLLKILRFGGISGLLALKRAVESSLPARAQVAAMARRDRRSVENEWKVV